MHSDWRSHIYPDDNLKAVTFKQGPIVPALKACPVALRRVREADPPLATDNELNDVKTRKLYVVLGGFIGHLRDRAA